jgi:hypothetical protein
MSLVLVPSDCVNLLIKNAINKLSCLASVFSQTRPEAEGVMAVVSLSPELQKGGWGSTITLITLIYGNVLH